MKNTIFHKLLSTLLAAKSFSEAENRQHLEKESEKEKRLNEVEKKLTEQSETISRQSEQIEKQTQLLEQISSKLSKQPEVLLKGTEEPSKWLLALIAPLGTIFVIILSFLVYYTPSIGSFEIIALLTSLVSITFYDVKFGEGNEKIYIPKLENIFQTQTALYRISLYFIAPLVIIAFVPEYVPSMPDYLSFVPWYSSPVTAVPVVIPIISDYMPFLFDYFWIVELFKRSLVFVLTCIVFILFINKILEINVIKKREKFND